MKIIYSLENQIIKIIKTFILQSMTIFRLTSLLDKYDLNWIFELSTSLFIILPFKSLSKTLSCRII
jgi:hypothetical protein